jgi:hypothetical protein
MVVKDVLNLVVKNGIRVVASVLDMVVERVVMNQVARKVLL